MIDWCYAFRLAEVSLLRSLDSGNAGVYMNIKLAAIFNSDLIYYDLWNLFASVWDLFQVNELEKELIGRLSPSKTKQRVGPGNAFCCCLFGGYLIWPS